MTELKLPLEISYETQGSTSVSDVIEALKATNVLLDHTVSLLPSLIQGVHVESSSLNVVNLSQQSPLRELFMVSLFLGFQDNLEQEVPPAISQLFGIEVGEQYDTLVTLAFLVVVFYGAGIAVDAVKRLAADSLPKQKYNQLLELLSTQIGKKPAEIDRILSVKFEKPKSTQNLITSTKRFFLPSHRENSVPINIGNERLEHDLIREIPVADTQEKPSDFDRYIPFSAVSLEIHAMDRDKSATGWAAIAPKVTNERLKLKVMPPLQPSDVWGHEDIVADIVVVQKFTAKGYKPHLLQLTNLVSSTPRD